MDMERLGSTEQIHKSISQTLKNRRKSEIVIRKM